ncbi:hypothetical protein EJP82_10190 [Paenibacillus anaericanus]|uniref:Uncharacterized protein n=1 Tax=Paenibacillus anaericanus TaxID=170367 RepID=A0A433YA03_9BACL|nr:Tad domain-containing protein [Paenibacillus anaericanus]RUT46618.1 hypothetical protein EJP82_10190 [Paenibacillus anaericanus]
MFIRDRSENGAVTIFLIVTFTVIFAFVAIFIDFARMYALQTKAEALTHAAARSLLSAFDKELVEQYGLFAYGETDENYIMSKVLQDNFDLAVRSDDLPLLRAKLDSSSVELLRPLGIYSVFESQIREEMKYKAPIDFALDIINRFKPMAQVMKETSNTVDLLGKLQKLYDKREAKLDELLDKQKKAALTVESLSSLLPRSPSLSLSDESVSGIPRTAADLASQYADYQSMVEADRERELLERVHGMSIGFYQLGASNIFSEAGRSIRNAQVKHRDSLANARNLLKEVSEINEQMKVIIEQSEQRSAQDGYNSVSEGQSTGGKENVVGNQEIAKIREQSRSLLLPDDLIADFKSDIDGQALQLTQLQSEMSSMLAEESSVMSASASSGSLKSVVVTASREVDVFLQKYVDHGSNNILEENAATLERYRSYDNERKQLENQAGAKLKDASNILTQLKELKNKLSQYQEQFDQLESYFSENRTLNQDASSAEGTEGSSLSQDPYDAGEDAMGSMDTFYGGLSGVMSGMSDSCFQSEYIANYFQYFDVSTLDELLKGSGTGKLEALSEQFAYDKQEVEYILYGFNNPTGNIAAAYGEIFTMRLAIRTMEGFIKNVNKGNPLLILVSALLYGVEKAIEDMVTLAQKGSIPLSDFMKIELTYKDHLRIFLFLHGRSDKRLSRMLSIIRMETGINPDERATYAKGEVTTAMTLWFLPGVAKAMGSVGALNGRVEGSRYYVDKQADFSY